jgi:hypothetical protein
MACDGLGVNKQMEARMTEDEMKGFLKDNEEAIKLAVRDKLIAGIVDEHRWSITDEVSKAVNQFVKDEIVPDVVKHLAGEKGVILAAAIEGTRQIGNLITEKMVAEATKSINGYGMNDVLKSIFKGY